MCDDVVIVASPNKNQKKKKQTLRPTKMQSERNEEIFNTIY